MAHRSRSARDVVGNPSYADYLDQHAQELHAYYMAHGDPVRAELMMTRTLSESLMGNEGD